MYYMDTFTRIKVIPNSKSSESVNQVRPKSIHQQSKANKTI